MRVEAMRVTLGRLAALLGVAVLVSTPALAETGDADRGDEARVLQATSGRSPQPPRTPPPADVAPAHLDGAALDAWYNRRHGAPRPVAPHAPSAEVPDEDAERVLLADIARRRRDD